jgi:hypothetical protein
MESCLRRHQRGSSNLCTKDKQDRRCREGSRFRILTAIRERMVILCILSWIPLILIQFRSYAVRLRVSREQHLRKTQIFRNLQNNRHREPYYLCVDLYPRFRGTFPGYHLHILMDFTFYCLDCGQRYRAPRDRSGTKFPCQRCGWPLAVPGRAMAAGVSNPVATEAHVLAASRKLAASR